MRVDYVEPGANFFVTFISEDADEIHYPVPDITATTEEVALYFNGILQTPVEHYTVHQGTLRLERGPLPLGYNITIRR